MLKDFAFYELPNETFLLKIELSVFEKFHFIIFTLCRRLPPAMAMCTPSHTTTTVLSLGQSPWTEWTCTIRDTNLQLLYFKLYLLL